MTIYPPWHHHMPVHLAGRCYCEYLGARLSWGMQEKGMGRGNKMSREGIWALSDRRHRFIWRSAYVEAGHCPRACCGWEVR